MSEPFTLFEFATVKVLQEAYKKGLHDDRARKIFLDYVEKIFTTAFAGGALMEKAGFTDYQRKALEKIFFDGELKRIDTFALLWSRQVGKTTLMGVVAMLYVLLNYPSPVLILLVAPILRFSQNLYISVLRAVGAIGKYFRLEADTKTGYDTRFVARVSMTSIFFGWGARIICLPGKRVRGFSPNMIMIDEACFMPESSWQEILPMLKVKRAQRRIFILTSTPFGTTNRFYRFWQEANGGEQGYPFHVTYKDCPFSDKEKIEEDLREGLITENEYRREYLAEWVPGEGQAIPDYLIEKALADYETWDDDFFGIG